MLAGIAKLMAALLLSVIAIPVARAQEVTGGFAADAVNQRFLAPMCGRWMPVMHGLMKTPWPVSAPQYEQVTARFQPAWVGARPGAYRAVLLAWMDQQLTTPGSPRKLGTRELRHLVDAHLRSGRIAIWRTRLPVPFIDWPGNYPRYREITRIRFQPIPALFPSSPAERQLYAQAYYYIISDRRPAAADIGPRSANPAFLFLYRGIPFFLRPIYNQVLWAEELFPHSLNNPHQYAGIDFSFGCAPD